MVDVAAPSAAHAGERRRFEEVRRGAGREERGPEIGYRFDASPRWLEASGWREQSRKHRAAWPALRRLLELERWPGDAIRLTYAQLASHLCVSEDTGKRRLRALAGELGAIELRPGSGRSASVVRIKHPIHTPISYAEVPWSVGGLAGAPPGYIESLRGPKRAYAELYGVEIPDPAPIPEQDEAPPVEQTEAPPPEEPGPPSEEEGGQAADPGGALCPPSETGDVCSCDTCPSDAPAREAARRDGPTEDDTPAKQMAREAAAIPPGEISEGAVAYTRRVCEALGRRDEGTAHRVARVAELLWRQDRAYVMDEVVARLERTVGRGNVIGRPGAYLCEVILDVERSSPGAAEREVARRVLAGGSVREEGCDTAGVASYAEQIAAAFGSGGRVT